MNSFDAAIEKLIEQSGFAAAKRIKLMEDASTRTYERLVLGDKTAILMKAPPESGNPPCPHGATAEQRKQLGWNALALLAASRVDAFVAIAEYLRNLGFSTPEIYACDVDLGIAIIEDFGTGLFAEILKDQPNTNLECDYYKVAAAALAKLHEFTPPNTLPSPNSQWQLHKFDELALRVNIDLFIEWVPQFLGLEPYNQSVLNSWNDITSKIITKVLTHPRALTLRDYHAENILWLENREGLQKIGLLDFQDSVIGFRAWDFTMLLHDARRDVSQDAHMVAIDTYVELAKIDKSEFLNQLDLEGVLNIMRIIGIFSRLIKRDGKNKYRDFMPRMIGHLLGVLKNPELKDLKNWIEEFAPLKELSLV